MKIPPENCFPDPIFFLIFLAFYCLCGENFVTPFSTLAMIKGSLPTNSTTPDRLRSGAWTKTESEDFPGFWVRTSSKKVFSNGVRHLVLIYTPKEAHSQIFVTGRSVFARQMLKKFQLSWRGELVIIFVSRRPLLFICLVYIYISLNIYIIHHV